MGVRQFRGLGDINPAVPDCYLPCIAGMQPDSSCSQCQCNPGTGIFSAEMGRCIPVVVGSPAPAGDQSGDWFAQAVQNLMTSLSGGGGTVAASPAQVAAQAQAAAAGIPTVGCNPDDTGCSYPCPNGVYTTDPTLAACPGITDQISQALGISSGTIEILLYVGIGALILDTMGVFDSGGRRR
jgi:hypothetical protein